MLGRWVNISTSTENPTLPTGFTSISGTDSVFFISRWPVTQKEFSQFALTDDYNDRRFWSDEGWQAKNDGDFEAEPT